MECVVCSSRNFRKVPHAKLWLIEQCERCGLVQVVPMPTIKEISSLYHEDLEHFEPYIEQLPVHRKYFRKKIQEIKADSRLRGNDKTLLDIGCAMGVLLEEAKKIGFRAQGVDISKDAVAYCRKKGLNVSQHWPKKTLPAGRQEFDVVTAFEVIEHERDPLGMMRRVRSLLNSGGIAVLTTPNYSTIWRKIMGKWWVGYRHPEHVTFWDETSLRFLMEKIGFKNIVIRNDSPRPFPLSFLFTRSADYFPWAAFVLKPVGKFLDRWNIINPINPWDDLIVYAST